MVYGCRFSFQPIRNLWRRFHVRVNCNHSSEKKPHEIQWHAENVPHREAKPPLHCFYIAPNAEQFQMVSMMRLSLWRLIFLCALCTGAANHTLRPFLGCLRGLRMNGVPVDLEGKVDERTGIRRNCTGACLNASIPCRNGGQCIDGYASYSCDCNNTAFDGYYCHLGKSSTSFAQFLVMEVLSNTLILKTNPTGQV